MSFVTVNYAVTNAEFTSSWTLIRNDLPQSETRTSVNTITPVVYLIESCTSVHKSNPRIGSVNICDRLQSNQAAIDTTNRMRYVWH